MSRLAVDNEYTTVKSEVVSLVVGLTGSQLVRISISEGAYALLRKTRLPGESYSEVILRVLARKPTLSETAGSNTLSRKQWRRTKEVLKKADRLGTDRGRLSNSIGAWNMSDKEVREMFSGLERRWKKSTAKLRGKDKLAEKKSKGNLLDYVRSFAPDNELADRLEEVLRERGSIRLRAAGR